jgi:hypothetical protein
MLSNTAKLILTLLSCISFTQALAFVDADGEGGGGRPFSRHSNIEVKCLDNKTQKTIFYLRSLDGVESSRYSPGDANPGWIYRSHGADVAGIEGLRITVGMPGPGNGQTIILSAESPSEPGQVDAIHWAAIDLKTFAVVAVFDYRIVNRVQRISDTFRCTARIIHSWRPENSCDGDL